MKYYDKANKRIIQTDRKADAEFWDYKWKDDQIAAYDPQAVQPFITISNRFLKPRAKILEGGCGTAGKVAALAAAGYSVTGTDFAADTVARINAARPEFDILVGNVFGLDFQDGSFDAYWSFGVIEHFWEGYREIIAEARRVLRDDGYFFLTFPSMSPLRRLKARLGAYSSWEGGEVEPNGFYQFLLNPDTVCRHLQDAGFSIVHNSRIQATSGVKQELKYLWHASRIVGSRLPASVQRMIVSVLELSLGNTFGHLTLIAARKNKG